MNKTFKVGDIVGVSVWSLIDKARKKTTDHAEGEYRLSNTRLICTAEDEDTKYYDLYNESGELCCMDGESCTVTSVSENFVELSNEHGETKVLFTLSIDEANHGVSVLCAV